jgi:hypothetical protein
MFNHVPMRKLVLGILALVAIQFAFITYMMVWQPRVEPTGQLSQAPSTAAPNAGSSVPNENLIGDPSPEVTPEREVLLARTPPRPTRVKDVPVNVREQSPTITRAPAFRQSRPAFEPARYKVASRPLEFRNVVISYNRNPSMSDCEIREAPRARKRSYIAKATPVLKKPWQWIKAVGSKLN